MSVQNRTDVTVLMIFHVRAVNSKDNSLTSRPHCTYCSDFFSFLLFVFVYGGPKIDLISGEDSVDCFRRRWIPTKEDRRRTVRGRGNDRRSRRWNCMEQIKVNIDDELLEVAKMSV